MAKTELHDGNDAGISIGADTTQKIGFFGYTPAVQQAATAQSAVATTALTTITDIVTTASLTGAFNSVVSRVSALITLTNQLRSDMVAYGLSKGEA